MLGKILEALRGSAKLETLLEDCRRKLGNGKTPCSEPLPAPKKAVKTTCYS